MTDEAKKVEYVLCRKNRNNGELDNRTRGRCSKDWENGYYTRGADEVEFVAGNPPVAESKSAKPKSKRGRPKKEIFLPDKDPEKYGAVISYSIGDKGDITKTVDNKSVSETMANVIENEIRSRAKTHCKAFVDVVCTRLREFADSLGNVSI